MVEYRKFRKNQRLLQENGPCEDRTLWSGIEPFILNLKSINDVGHKSPDQWLPVVRQRLKTDIGRKLAEEIMATSWDAWWMDGYEE